MNQLHWWYIGYTSVYEPTVLVVYWPYTDVSPNCAGNFVITRPVYEPTMLVVHWPCINVCTNCIGNFVIPRRVYEPTMLVVHWSYINVWTNHTGSFVILGLVVVHQCMTQPYWYFCNLLFNVWTKVYGYKITNIVGVNTWCSPMFLPTILAFCGSVFTNSVGIFFAEWARLARVMADDCRVGRVSTVTKRECATWWLLLV